MKTPSPTSRGFSLVEISLALGIVSFAVLSIVSLLPIGMSNIQSASAKTKAGEIVSHIAHDLRSTPSGQSNTGMFAIAIPSSPSTGSASSQTLYVDDSGSVGSTALPTSMYRVEITFPSATTSNSFTYLTQIRIVWPALASEGDEKGEVLSSVAFLLAP